MKNVFTVGVICMTAFFQTLKAQKVFSNNEIRVTYSDASPLTLSKGIADALGNIFSTPSNYNVEKDEGHKSIGMFGIGYLRSITPKIRVGGDITFAEVKKETILVNKNTKEKDIKKISNLYFAFFPVFEYSYIKSNIIDFYGSVSAGVIIGKNKEQIRNTVNKDSNEVFAYQVNPVGIRIGKSFGGILELGYGFRGIINIGIGYKF